MVVVLVRSDATTAIHMRVTAATALALRNWVGIALAAPQTAPIHVKLYAVIVVV